MTPLISCQELSKSFGSRQLFTDLSVALFKGERVGLIGPNGAGKSTLLKVLAGEGDTDSGKVTRANDLCVGYVPQQVEDLQGPITEIVASRATGLDYLSPQEKESRIRRTLGELGFDDLSQEAETLSGGRKRRLTIACALVLDPDVLLLDEPTNHLDLDSILWLERFLKKQSRAIVITSHDRAFLDNVCNRMWEISHRYPKGIFASNGSYSDFLEQRELFLAGQKEREKGLRSKMRREEEWLRASPKARTTKARSRIQEAARLKHELAALKFRNREQKASVDLTDSGRQTKKLLEAKGISKSLGGKEILAPLDLSLYRGQRLGIVGRNGSGKSTLMKLLANSLDPDSGTIRYADDLKLHLFDQHRDQLDLTKSLREGLCPSGDTIRIRGQQIHVNSWAERFLFPKERLELPMNRLSGGERARVMIARMMAQPADLLFLDEPTNDLDIDTLEVLEESLDEFPGVVVLITHDRAMMDRVADELLSLDKPGEALRFDDTSRWLEWREQTEAEQRAAKPAAAPKPKTKSKLSYTQKKELEALERRIPKLEEKLATETEALNALSDPVELQRACAELETLQTELDAAYGRWEELA